MTVLMNVLTALTALTASLESVQTVLEMSLSYSSDPGFHGSSSRERRVHARMRARMHARLDIAAIPRVSLHPHASMHPRSCCTRT